MLLDEVGAGLVDSEITELIKLIQSIADPRTTIVIVEHVTCVVRECCARSMVLNFGKKLIEGATAEIQADDQVAAIHLGTGGARRSAASLADLKTSARVAAPEVERRILAPLIAPSAPASARAFVRREGVSAGYGQARVLRGLDLSIEEGQAIAILGPNGAGKTTLARVIAGAIAPTAGRLWIAGQDASGLSPHKISALGVAHCMEGRRKFATLSVEENLRIAARRTPTKAMRERLASVYDLFPILAERRNQPGLSMSGGQQQMLAIGRVADGAAAAGDFRRNQPRPRALRYGQPLQALALLREARMTLIVIEQDVDRALALADHAYVLEHGEFALSGTPSAIAADPRLRHIHIGSAE